MICDKCKNENVFCGQSFTAYKCKECGVMYSRHNTATPQLCRDCSEKTGRCEECNTNFGNNMDKDLMLQIDPELKFKGLIIDGKVYFSIKKDDWKVEEVDDIYIIQPKQ